MNTGRWINAGVVITNELQRIIENYPIGAKRLTPESDETAVIELEAYRIYLEKLVSARKVALESHELFQNFLALLTESKTLLDLDLAPKFEDPTPPPPPPVRGIFSEVFNQIQIENELILEKITDYNRLIPAVTDFLEKKHHELKSLEFYLDRVKEKRRKALDSEQDWWNFVNALQDAEHEWEG